MTQRARPLIFLLGLLLLTQPAFPQFQQLEKIVKSSSSQPAATPQQPSESERIQKKLTEARAALAELPDNDAPPPEGISPAALADRRQDHDQLVRSLSRHVNLLKARDNVTNDYNAALEALNDWKTFDTKPPYSILLVDELSNRLASLNEKKTSYESSIELFDRTLESLQREVPAAQEAANTANTELANATTPGEALKWNADAANLKQQLLIARIESIKSNLDLLNAQLSTVQIQLKLAEKQLDIARTRSAFSDEDLAKLRATADDHIAAIEKEISAANKKQKAAASDKLRARGALDKLLAANPENQNSPEIDLARFTLTAAESKADSLFFIFDNLGSLETLESYPITAYENRRTLSQASSRKDRDAAFRSLVSLRDRLAAWEVVTNNQLSTVNADLSQLNNTAAGIGGNDPRASLLSDQRAALWEKQSFLQRLSQSIANQRKAMDRWVKENEQGALKSIGAHIEDAATSAWTMVKNVWNFSVATYNDGTLTKNVKLGTVILALLYFSIFYSIAARLSRRLQHLVMRRVHIGEAQANTLRNWLMIVVGVALAISTLNFLSIPLTLFAFVGGALAIGLGFGTQTLIKNFISGIIVLFERKIRIGDIIDLGGLSGTIIEINTRSSVLRGGDGKETLVPNSLFLENRVTNLTLNNRRVRRFITIRAEYGTPPQQVMEILRECVERHGLILKEPTPIVTLEDFSDSGLVFGIYYWTEFNSKTNADVVASDIRIMVDKRFAEADIKMPTPNTVYPISTGKPLQLEISRPQSEPEQTPKSTATRDLP
ncbi:MAG: mechanosensitive ion channel [Luteolibacter sp.]